MRGFLAVNPNSHGLHALRKESILCFCIICNGATLLNNWSVRVIGLFKVTTLNKNTSVKQINSCLDQCKELFYNIMALDTYVLAPVLQ
mmetsp:Transcript_35794/g.61040  ORF Transcript_35794/g.61040 Transcript_35794/m.61040 type:complete len:88 (-) Transcript_35794:54-317(-)